MTIPAIYSLSKLNYAHLISFKNWYPPDSPDLPRKTVILDEKWTQENYHYFQIKGRPDIELIEISGALDCIVEFENCGGTIGRIKTYSYKCHILQSLPLHLLPYAEVHIKFSSTIDINSIKIELRTIDHLCDPNWHKLIEMSKKGCSCFRLNNIFANCLIKNGSIYPIFNLDIFFDQRDGKVNWTLQKNSTECFAESTEPEESVDPFITFPDAVLNLRHVIEKRVAEKSKPFPENVPKLIKGVNNVLAIIYLEPVETLQEKLTEYIGTIWTGPGPRHDIMRWAIEILEDYVKPPWPGFLKVNEIYSWLWPKKNCVSDQ